MTEGKGKLSFPRGEPVRTGWSAAPAVAAYPGEASHGERKGHVCPYGVAGRRAAVDPGIPDFSKVQEVRGSVTVLKAKKGRGGLRHIFQ